MKGRWLVLLLVSATIVAAIAVLAFLFDAFRTKTFNRLAEWPEFNRRYVSKWFTIPPEATILKAEEYSDPIMGGGFLVEFHLPESRDPAEWLKLVAPEDLRKHRRSAYRFDASHKITDIYWLEYRPGPQIYVAREHWD